MNKLIKKQNGFSLIELLVSLVILGLSVISILVVIENTYKQHLSSQRQYLRLQIEENILTVIKIKNAYSLVSGEIAIQDGVVLDISKKQITAWRRAISHPSGYNKYETALFEITIIIKVDTKIYPLMSKKPQWQKKISMLGWKAYKYRS